MISICLHMQWHGKIENYEIYALSRKREKIKIKL